MKLIINADDFGLSKSITDGIIEGIRRGYITSTTLMVNMPYAEYAIKEALKHNIKCIGLHINLTVGKPVIDNPKLTDDNGVFLYNNKQVENKNLTYLDAYNEIMAQVQLVEKLSGGKLKLDHLDCHHSLYLNKDIKKAINDVALKLNIPTRCKVGYNTKMPNELYDNFTIKNVSLSELHKMIKKFKDTNKTIELMTHSGYIDDYTKTVTSYLGREEELKVLKQAKESGLFNGIELISFSEF